MELLLPELRCTEYAVAFGQHITREQFIFLSGARQALQQHFDLLEDDMAVIGLRVDLACRIQLIREALDVAPDNVLASLLGTGLGADESFAKRYQGGGYIGPRRSVFQMAGSGV